MTSKEFKEIRERMGLTQSHLGKLMGMSFQSISKIETVRQPTKIQSAFILAIQKHGVK